MCCVWVRAANWTIIIKSVRHNFNNETQNEVYSSSLWQPGLSAFKGKIQLVDFCVTISSKGWRGWLARIHSPRVLHAHVKRRVVETACHRIWSDLIKTPWHLIALFFSTEQMGNIHLRYVSHTFESQNFWKWTNILSNSKVRRSSWSRERSGEGVFEILSQGEPVALNVWTLFT